MSASQSWLEQLPQNFVIGLEQGSIYSLVALGYTLVYGVLQLINFAHSEVFMAGGFGSFLVVDEIVGSKHHLGGGMVVFTIFAGVRGYLDSIETSKITAFEKAYVAYMKSSHADILSDIAAKGEITKETEAKLKTAVSEFVASFKA